MKEEDGHQHQQASKYPREDEKGFLPTVKEVWNTAKQKRAAASCALALDMQRTPRRNRSKRGAPASCRPEEEEKIEGGLTFDC